MTKQKIDNYKKQVEQLRIEEMKQNEMIELVHRQQQEKSPSLNRFFKSNNEVDVTKVYQIWLQQYKKTHPNFKENENKIHIDEHGNGYIRFQDPEAEENFVRNLAATCSTGNILDKGIIIATFQDGKLIDPRTNQEFPNRGYAELVQKLDAGFDYQDTLSPHSAAPTPFSMKPF